MDLIKDPLMKKAFTNPCLRQNVVNKGTMFVYCDYAGFASSNVYGVACCMVFNRTVSLSAKKLPLQRDHGSNYGEMMAIILSLETLLAALVEHQPTPKIAVIFTDCSRISQIIAQERFSNPYDEHGRNDLLAALANVNCLYPDVKVQLTYMRKHKRNNDLHRLAHNAARKAAFHPAKL